METTARGDGRPSPDGCQWEQRTGAVVRSDLLTLLWLGDGEGTGQRPLNLVP